MPIMSHSDLPQDDLTFDTGVSEQLQITPDTIDTSTLAEKTGAAFRVENTIVSALVNETSGVDNSHQEGFDIFHEIYGTEFEPHMGAFLNVFNDKMLAATKLKVLRELKDREILDTGGLAAMGLSFAAALLGPENLIPGGLAVKGVKAGYSVGKSAKNLAVAGGLSTVAAEGVLQQTQLLRTPEESALNIVAGTAISGMFGGGLAYLANRGIKSKFAYVLDEAAGFSPEFRAKLDAATPEQQADMLHEANKIIQTAKKEEIERAAQVSEEFRSKLNNVDDIDERIDELYAAARDLPGFGKGGDLGAASSAKTIDDLTLRGSAARAYTNASKYLHPYTRIMTQPSPWAREMAANLFENNLLLRLHESEALSSAVETNVKRWADAYLADALGRIGHDGKGGIYRDMRKANIQMELAEFREQISRALRRNDGNAVDNEGNDLGAPSGQFNEYVMKAAKTVRDDVLEKGRLELNKIGRTLASKQSKTALSYLTRVWNRKKLAEGEADFKDRNGVVWNYLNKALNAGIDDAAKKIETRIKNLTSEIHDIEDAIRRRDSEYKERTGVSIRELQEFDQINARLEELKAKLEKGPQIDPEAGAAFGDDVVEAFNRMLPPELRLEVVDEIESDEGSTSVGMADDVYYQMSDNHQAPIKTETSEFKEWFGDSKVVDGEGKPLVMYHGTDQKFEAFDPEKIGSRFPEYSFAGFYLHDKKSRADLYGEQVVEAYVSVKKPLIYETSDHSAEIFADLNRGMIMRDILDGRKSGNPADGVLIKGSSFGDQVVIAFEPTQIKSVNNRGTFDPNDPRILYQMGDEPRAKSTTDSLRGTHIKAPKELFEWLGVREAKFSADYEAIARKRAENLPDDPLKDPAVLRDHVEYVLSKAVFAFKHDNGNWNLIAFDSSERLVAVDLEYKKHSYKVVTALTPDEGQLDRKIRGAFKVYGEDGFRWKADPSPSRQGVPQEDLSFVNRTGAKGPLSADDIIEKVRQIQGERKLSKGNDGNVQGSFNPRENLMQIVRSAVDPQSTGQHELIHALRSMKLLQDDEWSLLEQSAKELGWIEKHNIKDRYKNVYEGNHQDIDNKMLEEAVAEEFGLWRQGKIEVTPSLQAIFQKIMDLLNGIAESLRSRGIENYDDIFELIESGDIANRGRQQMETEAGQLTARRDQIQLAGEQGTNNELREGLLPSEVQQALRVLNDPDTPKMPQTLRQFIQKEGGLLDQGGELKNRGWSKTTHPKLVKDVFIRNQIDAFNQSPNGSKKDGWTLDEMTQKLWEEGYFQERPSVDEMLGALSEDMSGTPRVRQSDELDLNLFLDRMALADELDRLGIDPSKRRHLHHTKDEERNLIAAVGKIMNNQDAEKIMKLKRKLDDAEFKKMSIPDIDDVNEVDEIVKSVFRKLMGEDVADDFVNENIVDHGFLKGRTFGIRDELVEHWLENDIEAILRSYVRNISGQIEMQKRFGSMDLEPHLSKIKDEFDKERAKVFADTNLNDKQRKKAIDKLRTQAGDVDRTLKFVRDKILGRYKNDIEVNTWTRTLDGAMAVQYMAALGGVLPSSLADMWRIPMTQGMARYFGKDLPRLISGNKGLKLNRKLAKKYAGIAEIVNNSRLAQIIGLNDPYIHQNPAEVFITKATSTFSKLTAMPYWNQFWKEFAGATVIDRALGNLMKGLDNVNGVERRWTNEAGFGMLAPYMGQLRQAKAVEKIQGVWTLHPDRVPDDLASQFYGAVKKEIDRTIITPGLADLPIRMHHPLGKAAFQFKSFGFASDQKMLMRGMQDDVGNMMGGLMGMASVGMFIYMLKTLEAGRELDDNPAKWVLEGIDRSGMFFVMFEANNVAEKLGLPGAYWASGARAPASRFATRNLSSSLMGPVFGSSMDVAALFGSGAAYLHPGREGDIAPTDIANARRITPYASLPPWRWAIDNYLVPALKDEVK